MTIEWLTTQEASELSGYHPERIRELMRDGVIAATKKGNSWWVDRRSLVAYIKAAEKSSDRRRGPKKEET